MDQRITPCSVACVPHAVCRHSPCRCENWIRGGALSPGAGSHCLTERLSPGMGGQTRILAPQVPEGFPGKKAVVERMARAYAGS